MWSETVLWSGLYRKGEKEQYNFLPFPQHMVLSDFPVFKKTHLSGHTHCFHNWSYFGSSKNIYWQPVDVLWGLKLLNDGGIFFKKKNTSL